MDSDPLLPLATAVIDVPAPERALVVGCREGDEALFLAREFPAARVRGVDRSAATIRRATARVGLDPEGRIAFKRGTARDLPFPDVSFDLVAQGRGIPFGRELRRVLRPGGHLIYVGRPRQRLRRLRASRLEWALSRHGFEAVRTGDSAGVPFYVGRLTG